MRDNIIPNYSVKNIDEEVRHFVTSSNSYYGVTVSGFLFDIIQNINIQSNIVNPDDYYTYMWINTAKGYFILQQRFLNKKPKTWCLKVEIIPENFTYKFFEIMKSYFLDNSEVLDNICSKKFQ